jgi:hypothetical protein
MDGLCNGKKQGGEAASRASAGGHTGDFLHLSRCTQSFLSVPLVKSGEERIINTEGHPHRRSASSMNQKQLVNILVGDVTVASILFFATSVAPYRVGKGGHTGDERQQADDFQQCHALITSSR